MAKQVMKVIKVITFDFSRVEKSIGDKGQNTLLSLLALLSYICQLMKTRINAGILGMSNATDRVDKSNHECRRNRPDTVFGPRGP